MAPLSLRTTISALAAASIAIVALITLTITISTSLTALRSIGKSHASVLLDGASLKTLALFDGPLTITETLQNFTSKYQWNWPSDDPAVYRDFHTMHEAAFFSSKLKSASVLTYCADNTRWMYGPFIPEPSLYVMQHHIASSITAANWNFTQQTIANEVGFWYMANHSAIPTSHWAWSVPLALSKVRQTTLWSGTLLTATGGGMVTVIAPVSLVNFAGISNLYVPIFAPMYRRDDDPRNVSQIFGVTISALYIDEISDFLREVRGTPNTAAFAIEGSGYLIGSSLAAEHPFQVESQANATDPVPGGCASTGATAGVSTNTGVIWVCRTHARNYAYAPLRAMAAMEYEGVNFMRVDGRAVQHTSVDGDFFYFATLNLPLRAVGLRVQLLLAMPEEDVIGDVVAGRNLAIGITCAVFVVVAALMFGLVTVLLSPLHDVSERMLLAATLEDSEERTEPSVLQEVADLQASYDAMNNELCRIRSFVPQSIIASRLTADDVDMMEGTTNDDDSSTRGTADRSQQSKSGLGHKKSSYALGRSKGDRRSANSVRSSNDGVLAGMLKNHAVTVVVCNLDGFHHATGAVSKEAAARGIAEVVDLVVSEVADHGGVLANFNGDAFTASFNAVRPCPSHARRGCATALAVTERAPMVGLRLTARVGVSTGKCLLGNAGTAAVKSFNVVGPAVTQAATLERLAKAYGVPVLVPERTCADVATHMSFQYIDLVMLPGRSQPSLIGRVVATRSENAAPQDNNDGEWLYVVQNNDANDPYAAANECFRLIAHGDRDAAAKFFAEMEKAKSAAATQQQQQDTPDATTVATTATAVEEKPKPRIVGGVARLEELVASPAPRDLGLYYRAAFA